MRPLIVVVVDVDGVVSPVHGVTRWSDDVVAGNVFGPVHVSPALNAHLDALAQVPGVRCRWLTSWSPEMRGRMDPFPGWAWAALNPGDIPSSARTWWKLAALEQWLAWRNAGDGATTAPERPVGTVVWLDDDLWHGARKAACTRRLEALGVESLLIAPHRTAGLTPQQMLEVGEWVKRRVAKTDRHLLDQPWRVSPVAPCGCAWDGLHCPHCSLVTAQSGDAWHPAHTIPCHDRSAAWPRSLRQHGNRPDAR